MLKKIIATGIRRKFRRGAEHFVLAVRQPEAEIPPALYWAGDHNLRLRIPIGMLTMQGAFAYSGGWHPFVEALRHGPQVLTHFYRAFQPGSLGEMYFLENQVSAGIDLPPWELPWVFRKSRTPPPGEGGLGREHGVSFFGPVTEQKVEFEYTRLVELYESVEKRDYLPELFGDIEGYFIRSDEGIRFFVRGGKHRAAVLAYRGDADVRVKLKPCWPRLIDASQAGDWPMVARGAISKYLGERVLSRYVEFDGSQQFSALTASRV